MRSIIAAIACIATIAFASSQARAQPANPSIERADILLALGDPISALDILETLRPTLNVLSSMAHAHLMLAGQTTGYERCAHARDAYQYAAMASLSWLVDTARRIEQDERCSIDR